MPTYDYRCRKCGHRFELFHGISDAAPKKCPKCRGRAVRVPAAGAGILFKGSGFYITDYRSRDYRERARSEKGGTADAASQAAGGESSSPASGRGADGTGAGKEGGGKPAGKGTERSRRPRGRTKGD